MSRGGDDEVGVCDSLLDVPTLGLNRNDIAKNFRAAKVAIACARTIMGCKLCDGLFVR